MKSTDKAPQILTLTEHMFCDNRESEGWEVQPHLKLSARGQTEDAALRDLEKHEHHRETVRACVPFSMATFHTRMAEGDFLS